ncbi:hypothetical protein DU53_02450 [Kosmotoga sp. DU53]|nr:hypothetical protein DU53_02450 [Kosmotoga sp. DU53]
MKVVYFESEDTELNNVLPEIVNRIIHNKEDLRGRVRFEAVSIDKFKPSRAECLYITTFETLKKINKNIVNLFGKTIFLYSAKLNTEIVKQAQMLSAVGIFDQSRFYGDRLEYSEIARFEQVLKKHLRKKLSYHLLEQEQCKYIDWKVKYEPEDRNKYISLFSDDRMKEAIAMANRIASNLKGYVETLEKIRDCAEVKKLFKLEISGIESSKTKDITKVEDMYSKITEKTESFGLNNIEAVLITGPTGSGKTLMAKYLANELYGDNFQDYFSKIPIVNLSENLVESELFGSFPGAFTDSRYKIGKLLANAGGVVFIDEIGDISPKIQAKLLTYLDDMRIIIEGYSNPKGVKAPVFIIAATNKDLPKEIEKGNFRADLYHRFKYKISLPSLQERKSDLRYLISFVLQEAVHARKSRVKKISIKAIEKLEDYSFPGNFRELESIIFEAVANADLDQRDCVLERDIKI